MLLWCLLSAISAVAALDCHSRGPESEQVREQYRKKGVALGLDCTQAVALWRVPRREARGKANSSSSCPFLSRA